MRRPIAARERITNPKQDPVSNPAILFDLDGTLLDSNYEHVLAWRLALRHEGLEIPNAFLHRCIGMRGELLIKAALKETDRTFRDRTKERLEMLHKRYFKDTLSSVRPLSHDIQLPVVEPSPVIPSLLRQSATLPPAQSSSDDLASLSTTNGEVQQIPISPCARGQQVERPQTGMRIEPDEGGSGESQLKISNGTDRDAAVRLLSQETGTTARFVYINAGGQYTLGNIVPGTYLLRFSSGHDWVSACRDFLDPEYSEFERTLVFEDVVLNDGQERYNVMEITLNPVPFGNATTRTIDRKRFFEGDRHVKLIP